MRQHVTAEKILKNMEVQQSSNKNGKLRSLQASGRFSARSRNCENRLLDLPCLPVCLPARLPACLSACLPVCLSVDPSVHLSEWNNSASTGRIFMKFHT